MGHKNETASSGGLGTGSASLLAARPPQADRPGEGCRVKNPYDLEQVRIQDCRDLRREALHGGAGAVVAGAIGMRPDRGSITWLKVETEGANAGAVAIDFAKWRSRS